MEYIGLIFINSQFLDPAIFKPLVCLYRLIVLNKC